MLVQKPLETKINIIEWTCAHQLLGCAYHSLVQRYWHELSFDCREQNPKQDELAEGGLTGPYHILDLSALQKRELVSTC